MKQKQSQLIFLVTLVFLSALSSCSCSKEEEENWGAVEMWKMAVEKDPSIELVFVADTPEGRLRRITCQSYPSDGCVVGSGKRIKVRLVELIVLQYESKRDACLAALGIEQWYARNWIFDDVSNEPVLEDFVKKVFSAKKPNKPEDCN